MKVCGSVRLFPTRRFYQSTDRLLGTELYFFIRNVQQGAYKELICISHISRLYRFESRICNLTG